MFICFFDHKDIVRLEFINQEQTVNQYCYLTIHLIGQIWNTVIFYFSENGNKRVVIF